MDIWICDCGARLKARHDIILNVYDIASDIFKGLSRSKSHILNYALECPSCSNKYELLNVRKSDKMCRALNSGDRDGVHYSYRYAPEKRLLKEETDYEILWYWCKILPDGSRMVFTRHKNVPEWEHYTRAQVIEYYGCDAT